MKQLNRILGYLNIGDAEYPFHFETEDFILRVYPPTMKKWSEDMFGILENFGLSPKAHEWIGLKRITGITSQHYKIIFCVSDNPSSENGFKEYNVVWLLYHSEKYDANAINGLRLSGGDINYFLPAERALESKIHFKEEFIVDSLSVTSKSSEYLSGGKYRLSYGIDAELQLRTYATLHHNNAGNPIEAGSLMLFNYSRPVNLDLVIKNINETRLLLAYSCYRGNIYIPTIEIYWMNEEQKRDFAGIMLFPRKSGAETNKKANERIITYDFWGEKTCKMLTVIKNNKLSFHHVCKCIDDQRHYLSSRIIMILAEFEREYRNIYGIDYLRSDRYKDLKEEVIDTLNQLASTKKSKERQYIKNYIKMISNNDDSFTSRVEAALLDCEAIMKPFVMRKYNGIYEDIVPNIAVRAGQLRNGLAHSKLDMTFEPINLSDIKIMEELTYAIRLKKFAKDTAMIQKAINKLFGENIAI